MERRTSIIRDGSLAYAYYGDDDVARYVLAGERFKYSDELLSLIAEYHGACMEDPDMFARSECNFDCMNCERSIYHTLNLKEKFFNQRCVELCNRYPKIGDQWEISIHTLTDHPHYEVFFFHCLKNIDDRTIIELCSDLIQKMRPNLLQIAKYCYVKIRRADMQEAYDVSISANKMLRTLMEKHENS